MYAWRIEPLWIVWLPGLVPALNVVCRAYGADGDEVVTFTPIHPPFLTASSQDVVLVPTSSITLYVLAAILPPFNHQRSRRGPAL